MFPFDASLGLNAFGLCVLIGTPIGVLKINTNQLKGHDATMKRNYIYPNNILNQDQLDYITLPTVGLLFIITKFIRVSVSFITINQFLSYTISFALTNLTPTVWYNLLTSFHGHQHWRFIDTVEPIGSRKCRYRGYCIGIQIILELITLQVELIDCWIAHWSVKIK